jgi:formylglycine-generating enzyme required for sulfatase activity
VVLLAGARARRVESSVWALAEALCPTQKDPSSSLEDQWGAFLAGQVLAESVDLSFVESQDKPKLKRVQEALCGVLQAESFPAKERVAVGKSLSVLGDPRFDARHWWLPKGAELGFVEIPAGPFLMGSDRAIDLAAYQREIPQRPVLLPRYWLSRFPVTVGQFRVFVEQTGCAPKNLDCLEGASNLPVAWVTWQEAQAYCEWLGDRLVEKARTSPETGALWMELRSGSLRASLPSEAEWEKGARGLDGRLYPWGNAFDLKRANCDRAGIGERSAVGCFSCGASTYGCEDLSGNVWEWTRGIYPDDTEESPKSLAQISCVLRGSAFNNNLWFARCAYRRLYIQDDRYGDIGFRVVLSPFRL